MGGGRRRRRSGGRPVAAAVQWRPRGWSAYRGGRVLRHGSMTWLPLVAGCKRRSELARPGTWSWAVFDNAIVTGDG